MKNDSPRPTVPEYLSRVWYHGQTDSVALILTIPWLITPIVASIRMMQSTSLDDESPEPAPDTPLVSVIVPARNEAHNIAACLRSVLATTYPRIEIFAVDDQSTDGTAAIAHAIARDDARLSVLETAPLPDGWFGKQWACQSGADAAAGDILIFIDADARASEDLITRSVNGMLRNHADFYSVLGRQEMVTFWEKLLQMQIFAVLLTRFGGTSIVNRSRSAAAKIANGQYLMVRRATYDEHGGHGLVRGYVAEDLMLARRYFELGKKTMLVTGLPQLSTRMYTSLRGIIAGWRKNLFAGGRHSLPFGLRSTVLAALLIPLPFIMQLAPPLMLIVALSIQSHALLLWASITTVAALITWIGYHRAANLPVVYALLYPVGAAVALYIAIAAVLRGSRVEWKGRKYESAHPRALV
jgi:chlorobactene glucosyltransferase